MARPKKGTKGDAEATAKWKKTMEEKYGGKEKLSQLMRTIGSKGGQSGRGEPYMGGFASNRELAKIAGRKGGLKSRRTSVAESIKNKKEYIYKGDLDEKIVFAKEAQDNR